MIPYTKNGNLNLINHNEMLCQEVEEKMVSRTVGNIDLLIDENASIEGLVCKGTKSTVITGTDVVMNYRLQENSCTKEVYEKYIKDYMKLGCKLEEHRPEREKPFMTRAAEQIKHVPANLKNYQFFIDESMNPDVIIALQDYREYGVTSFMIFFQESLEMKKMLMNLAVTLDVSPVVLTGYCSLSTQH
uniref:Translationally-controlled tumor protein n=1 Tax=Suricata suricatta TaxID=37032 RepID=A0A673VH44_SURSU